MCNPIPPLFGIEKRKDTLCWADCCLFLVEKDNSLPLATLFSDFSESKKSQKIFAAQTPQRKRGFLSTRQTIVGKVSPHLRNSLSSLADAPHCSMMGSVQILTLVKAKAIFYIVLQSTGHTFPTSSPTAR